MRHTPGAPNPVVSKNPEKTLEGPGAEVAYHSVNLSDLVIEERGKDLVVSDQRGRFEPKVATNRFTQSLSRKTGVRTDFFKLFSPMEVLDRVIETDGDQSFVFVEDDTRALAISLPGDPIVRLEEAMRVIAGYDPLSISYHQGELKASFTPRKAGGNTSIVGEEYAKNFQLTIPIDALSHPSVAPLIIRQVCENGLVAETAAFSAPVVIGKMDAGHTIGRALEAYNGDRVYAKIAERLELSRGAWSSVAEVDQFCKALLRSGMTPQEALRIFHTVWERAGAVARTQFRTYEKTNPKVLRKIATEINRYDLINMVTEARSHFASHDEDRWDLDAVAGTLLQRDPDLEGTAEPRKTESSPAFFFKQAA